MRGYFFGSGGLSGRAEQGEGGASASMNRTAAKTPIKSDVKGRSAAGGKRELCTSACKPITTSHATHRPLSGSAARHLQVRQVAMAASRRLSA